jgi:hypothetical protein
MWHKFLWVNLIAPHLGVISLSCLRATCTRMHEWLPDKGQYYRKRASSVIDLGYFTIQVGDDEAIHFVTQSVSSKYGFLNMYKTALHCKRFKWIQTWYHLPKFENIDFVYEAYEQGVILTFLKDNCRLTRDEENRLRIEPKFADFFAKHYKKSAKRQCIKP